VLAIEDALSPQTVVPFPTISAFSVQETGKNSIDPIQAKALSKYFQVSASLFI
jgi:hypothetical protein